MKKCGLSHVRTYPIGGNPEVTKIKRQIFSNEMKNIDYSDIICLDETSIYEKPCIKDGQ